MRPECSSEELEALANALVSAVAMDFMSREHAAAIWKNYLRISRWDVPKKEVGIDDITKKS